GEVSVWGEPPCFAMMHRDGFELMLSLGDSKPNGNGVWDVYARLLDADSEMAVLTAAGVAIDKGPTDMFYDMREIEIVDPDGYRWCFAHDTTGAGRPEAGEGTLEIAPARLRLVLKISGKKASLDSIDQGAMNLPVELIRFDGGGLQFEMKALQAA